MKKTGLVMEGGAMRGMFTCGIIDVLMENHITFDAAVGVSAGAAFGCNYKSGQIGRAVRYNKNYCKDKRYSSFWSWLTTGDFFNAEFCYRTMPLELDPWDAKAFAENPMDFYCVVTNVETGKAEYHKLTDGGEEDIQWIRASASIPMFSRPVPLDGQLYLDGGISDSIPLKFMESKVSGPIVVIETQPVNYRKSPQNFKRLVLRMLKQYPKMVRTMFARHLMYNAQKDYIREKERKGEVLVIRPKAPLNIKSTNKDPEELERVYQIGRATALDKLEQVREYLGIIEMSTGPFD